MSVGVIVGRFQIDNLHEGHKALIKHVVENNNNIIIGIGVAPVPHTQYDPMNYRTREEMLRAYIPTATILPIFDNPSNVRWCEQLNRDVRALYPREKITLYGGTGSFLNIYRKYAKSQLPTETYDYEVFKESATIIRERIRHNVESNDSFRRGVIHSALNKFPIISPVVDAAVYMGNLQESPNILLGRKGYEEGGKFRFIGGFVDPDDNSFEDAIIREVKEETSIDEVADIEYVGSGVIDTWYFRHPPERMFSSLYIMKYIFGKIQPADDIKTLEWVPWEMALGQGRDDESMLIPEHQRFGEMLYNFILKRRKSNV